MKRLPVIRHIRWAWHSWQVERHHTFCRSIGIPLNGDDNRVLTAIWNGEF
jgi:hypothetical protein